MTHDELREAAVKAAKRMRDNNREVHRVMFPHADEEQLWLESTDRANVMARYVLSLYDPTPVDRAAFAESLACVSYILDNRWQLSTAGQLRMLKGLATSIPPARTGGSE